MTETTQGAWGPAAEPTEYTYFTPGPAVLEIRNPRGAVRIELSDTDTTTVALQHRRATGSAMLNDLQDWLGVPRGSWAGFGGADPDQPGFRVHHEPALVSDDPERNSTEQPGGRVLIDVVGQRRSIVDVVVQAPARSGLRVQTRSGDVEVRGMAGLVDLQSASGNLSLDQTTANALLRSVSGRVRVGTADGDLRVSSVSGNVSVEQVAGSLTAESTSGNLRLSHSGGNVRARSISGTVTLADVRRGQADVKSVSGDVVVGIAAGILAAVDVSSVSGRTSSDFQVTDNLGTAGSDATASTSEDAGPATESGPDSSQEPALEVKVHTTSGNIRLQRAA